MWLFIRHLFQLILAPSKGWEDISAAAASYVDIQKNGYFPLIVLTALFEFFRLVYSPTMPFIEALANAVAIGGGLFVSVFAARLFLDIVLTKFINQDMNILKINKLAIYLLGVDCLYRILSDLIPAALTLLSFLPLVSVIIIFKSAPFLSVPDDRIINYLALVFIGVIIIPLAICGLLLLIL